MNAPRQQLLATRRIAAARSERHAVERVAELLVLPKLEQNALLTNFLQGGDHTQWGLVNAITAVANNVDDYDRAGEIERFGGRMLSLQSTQWRELAKAA